MVFIFIEVLITVIGVLMMVRQEKLGYLPDKHAKRLRDIERDLHERQNWKPARNKFFMSGKNIPMSDKDIRL